MKVTIEEGVVSVDRDTTGAGVNEDMRKWGSVDRHREKLFIIRDHHMTSAVADAGGSPLREVRVGNFDFACCIQTMNNKRLYIHVQSHSGV